MPDSPEVRQRIVARHQANSTQPFDLLAKVGQDSVGALQLVPDNTVPTNVKALKYQGKWCLPLGTTPTSHIIKLPIGQIITHSHTLDLSDSVENEYLCMLIAKEYGLPVPNCEIIQVGDIKALAVERFDRRYSSDKSWLMRIPQEDFCQTLNVPSASKYENQGGPGITAIMAKLLGSTTPDQDRHTFMCSQVLFWLLAATDGHAKNFSLFIQPEGRYQLTPLYDILSLYPMMGGKGLNRREAKLAMGLTASKRKEYAIEKIFPRHFLATAKAVSFSQPAMTTMTTMTTIMLEFAENTPKVIERVKNQLPDSFPQNIRETILDGLKQRAIRLTM